MTIEVPDGEKHYYRNKERIQLKELNNKKDKIIGQLTQETQILLGQNRELENKSQEQSRKIIEQQKDLHEKESNHKKQIETLEEQIADLTTEKEEEEYRFTEKILKLTEQLEKGKYFKWRQSALIKMFLFFNFSC